MPSRALAAAARAVDAGAEVTNTHSTIFSVVGLTRSRVLFVAPKSSYRTAAFVDTANRRGIELIIASEGRYSLVSSYAAGIHIDFSAPDTAVEDILRETADQPISGVVAADDTTTELAARIAQRLNLVHNDPESARIARRKDLARICLKQAGLRVPYFRIVDLQVPVQPQLHDIPLPCVAKPLAMSASRGVIRANDYNQLVKALTRIRNIIADEPNSEENSQILVEEFIPGFEVAVEGIISASKLKILAIFDKPDPLNGPYFEETFYVTPTRLSGPAQLAIQDNLETACSAYRLREGPIHAECRINDRGVWILEIASRTIGGLCSRLFEIGAGYNLEELVLNHAIGVFEAPRNSDDAAGVLMIPTLQAGVLRRVEGVQAASEIDYIEEVNIHVREGYELVPLPEGSSYLGFIFSRAPNAKLAELALRKAYSCLKVVVAPVWKARVESS